jgi:hypothetical protein
MILINPNIFGLFANSLMDHDTQLKMELIKIEVPMTLMDNLKIPDQFAIDGDRTNDTI